MYNSLVYVFFSLSLVDLIRSNFPPKHDDMITRIHCFFFISFFLLLCDLKKKKTKLKNSLVFLGKLFSLHY